MGILGLMGWRYSQLLQQVQSLLSINALPYAERNMVLQNAAAQREAQAQFDISRLVDLSERIILDYTAAQVSRLVTPVQVIENFCK